MNLEEIEKRISEIRASSKDDENAHGMEDMLHQDVLRAIADGTCRQPAECARLALATLELDFARWCA